MTLLRQRMTRIQYNLPVALLEKLEALSDRKEKPINQIITHALQQTYPELRSNPARTLSTFMGSKPSQT